MYNNQIYIYFNLAGQERFRTITQSYYRSANAIIIVYDVSNQPSFDRLPEWLRELKQHINDKVVVVLVGNKCDLVQAREIPYHIGEQFAQRHNMKFIETSAKDSENVEKVFYEIAETLTKQANELYASTKSNGINLNDKSPKTNKIGDNVCCSN